MSEYTPETLRQIAGQLSVMSEWCEKRDNHGDEVDAKRYGDWALEVYAHADAWQEQVERLERERETLHGQIDGETKALLARIEALERAIQDLARESASATQTLSNLGHGDLTGDPASIALNAAAHARRAIRLAEVAIAQDDASPYCQDCGACGEEACCPPSTCTHGPHCLYGEYYDSLGQEKEEMKRITVEMLRKHHACEDQVELFEETFPKGAPVTMRSLAKAQKAGLDVLWCERLLTGQAWAEYEKVKGQARAEYDKAMRPALVPALAQEKGADDDLHP